MSRIASQAVGGYFKTQDEIRPLIYRRFAAVTTPGGYCVVDPCAGEGEAVRECVAHVFGGGYRDAANRRDRADGVKVDGVCIELEAERAQRAQWSSHSHFDTSQLHCGDGLCCEAAGAGASLLWNNPPYDFFRGERFEARFLDAWTPRVAPQGQLVLIVPEHTLEYLAATLTRWYDDLEVLRYPEPTYSDFKQVVVLGTKRVLEGEVGTLPPIGCLADEPATLRRVPPGALKVDVNALDVAALRQATSPWCGQAGYDRPASPPQIGLAMKPKPAHVAMALGSGVFNGVRLTTTGRHDLLAKAVFHRQFVDADAKKDEHGDVVKLTQVERPQLRLTVLDLETGEYRELLPATEPTIDTETLQGEIVNFADLLLVYGDSMVAAMRERCPSLHGGEEDVPLRPMARSLFPAQSSAVRAALKLVARGMTPLVLGEIGSGKTSCALSYIWNLNDGTALKAIRGLRFAHEDAFPHFAHTPLVRRALVVCPPHLVQNWIDEAAKCLPQVPVRVLERVADVDAAAAMQDDLVLCVLSREQAKLGHGVEGVDNSVTIKRGTPPQHHVPSSCPRCGARVQESQDKLGKSRAVCEGKLHEPLDGVARVAWEMSQLHRRGAKLGSDAYSPLRRRAAVVLLRYLKNHTTRKKRPEGKSYGGPETDRVMLSGDATTKIVACLKLCGDDARIRRALGVIFPKPTEAWQEYSWPLKDFAHKLDDAALCRALGDIGKWRVRDCGEPLYQAVPTPRRYPLADYICKKHPTLFQLVVPDEFHEYSTDGSAQERALHRLTETIPFCLPLTGSLMNGYAKSLFRNLWAVSRRMRAEFAYDDHTKFCKLYGYQKRVLTGDALKKAKVTEVGSVSDRVVKTEGGERLSDAPGVLPSFVLRHVLPLSVTLHKRDITPDDRVVDHSRDEIVIVDSQHRGDGSRLGSELREAVKRNRYDEDLAGKLFGQLAEYPSYFDRATADTGNAGEVGSRTFEIRYPDDVGGALVAQGGGLDAASWLAKEEWLVRTLRRELDEGRNVLLFLWHKELSERLIKLCRSVGEIPAFLDAGKVQAKKRQDWIDKNVVGKRRVMITNPTCVMTGLNNLIWFSTAIFFENPGCNPFVARQAVGRLDRITQQKDVRVYWPVYEGVQCALLDLLQAKTAISQQIDGIDPTAALEMAGAGDGAAVQAQDVGLAVYRYLGGD